MELLRSEEVHLYTVTVSRDCAWKTIFEIGKLNCLHFIDINRKEQIFTRTHAQNIRKCEEATRKILYLKSTLSKFSFHPQPPPTVEQYLVEFNRVIHEYHKDVATFTEDIDKDLSQSELYLEDQIKLLEDCKLKKTKLTQQNYVLKKLNVMSHDGEHPDRNSVTVPLRKTNVVYIAGILPKYEMMRFTRTIFRATRGNAYTTSEDCINEGSGLLPLITKSFFTIMYNSSDEMRKRLLRICETFNADYFEVDQNFEKTVKENEGKIIDAEAIIQLTSDSIKNKCKDLMKPFKGGQYSFISMAELLIQQDGMIYSILNMMKLGAKTYKGLAWCTKSNGQLLTELNDSLSKVPDFIAPRFKKMEKTTLTPPTVTYTNEFIAPFQSIVDTYGVPNYQEANPALFSIITFPFMFGIMFGDFCHGLVIIVLVTYVCLDKEKLEKNKSMLCPLIPIRYLLLLMGIFAAFCGFIYNDFASVPLNIFHSCYNNNIADKIGVRKENCVYPFGLDHKWYVSDNELAYINSFKMKISVIFGIAQMMLGIILKGANAIHFRKPLDFFFEFMPQLLFLGGIFGYMIIIIFIKWGTNWAFVGNNAPSVISFLIDLVLNMGDPGPTPFYGDGTVQKKIALILLTLSVVCVPWMLFLKPFLLKKEHQPQKDIENGIVNSDHTNEKEMGLLKGRENEMKMPTIKEKKKEIFKGNKMDSDNDTRKFLQEKVKNALETSVLIDKPEKFDFSEIFVHQLIECIEFVLGTVSNTASYLRLWALSLAHAQLSKVFFDKILAGFIRSNSSIGIFIGVLYLAQVTFGILMCMDIMECFLHALRLHWVEFQNKFYKASGYKLIPFGFGTLLKKK